MSRKQHIVHLTPTERDELQQLHSAGRAPARMQTRARILLKADAGVAGPGWTDAAIAEALETSSRTVARVRAQCASRGVAATLQRQPRSAATQRKLDAVRRRANGAHIADRQARGAHAGLKDRHAPHSRPGTSHHADNPA